MFLGIKSAPRCQVKLLLIKVFVLGKRNEACNLYRKNNKIQSKGSLVISDMIIDSVHIL